MSEEKEVTYEELSNYEIMRTGHGANTLRDAIIYLQNTNDMRIVFREELAAINKALTSIEKKRGGIILRNQ